MGQNFLPPILHPTHQQNNISHSGIQQKPNPLSTANAMNENVDINENVDKRVAK